MCGPDELAVHDVGQHTARRASLPARSCRQRADAGPIPALAVSLCSCNESGDVAFVVHPPVSGWPGTPVAEVAVRGCTPRRQARPDKSRVSARVTRFHGTLPLARSATILLRIRHVVISNAGQFVGLGLQRPVSESAHRQWPPRGCRNRSRPFPRPESDRQPDGPAHGPSAPAPALGRLPAPSSTEC